jgi:hypothetical protein
MIIYEISYLSRFLVINDINCFNNCYYSELGSTQSLYMMKFELGSGNYKTENEVFIKVVDIDSRL